MRLKSTLTASIFVVAAIAATVPVRAASPLAAIPVGSSASYKLTTQTMGAKKRPKSAVHNVVFTRTSQTAIGVKVDRKKSGTITVGTDGTLTVPSDLQTALGPFNMIESLMHSAPSPVAADNTWTAVTAVPVGDQTDNVSVTLKVTQLSEGTLTVTGSGNNTMDVTVGTGTQTANVTVNATMSYGSNHELTSASGSATATVPGKKKQGGGQFGTSWTITQGQ
jgi:hypothetical protein